MDLNLSIKGVPADIAERLRQRAERNHRSLQGELMAIIEQAALQGSAAAESAAAAPAVASPTTFKQGWKTVDELVMERRAQPLKTTPGLPRAVDIIRADRDSP